MVQGRPIGRTPDVRLPVYPGTYQVQVGCEPEQLSRIHVAQAKDGELVVNTHVGLDHALRLDRADPYLQYATGEQVEARSIDDATVVGRAMGARFVLLVSYDEGDHALLQTLDAHRRRGRRRVDNAEIETNPDRLTSKLSEKLTKLTGSAPSMDVAVASAAAQHQSRSNLDDTDTMSSERIAGYTAAGVGLAGIATGWVLSILWVNANTLTNAAEPFDPDYDNRKSVRDSLSASVWITGAASSTLLTAALPFVLPDRDSAPWWSWVAGGVGLAGVAAGTILWSMHGQQVETDFPGVFEKRRTDPVAPFLLMQGIPLLAVPIVYLIRDATGAKESAAAVSASADQNQLRIRLSGSF